MNHNEDYDIGRHGANVGIVVNVILFIFKLFAGIWGKSHAMVADAFHTATDLLTSIGVFIGFQIAQRPADEEHPYGHGRAESIVAKLLAIVLIMAGLKIAYDAIILILNRHLHPPHVIALWAALISIITKEWLFKYTYRLGVKINSNSLKADAWHHRSDALSSVATFIGIGGALLGHPVLDPLAALVVSFFIVKIGLGLFHTAYDELMDATIPKKMLDDIEKLTNEIEGVKRIKDIKGRKMGIDIFVDLTIAVDKAMSVEAAHIITIKIRRNILKNLHGAKDIFIHVEPFE